MLLYLYTLRPFSLSPLELTTFQMLFWLGLNFTHNFAVFFALLSQYLFPYLVPNILGVTLISALPVMHWFMGNHKYLSIFTRSSWINNTTPKSGYRMMEVRLYVRVLRFWYICEQGCLILCTWPTAHDVHISKKGLILNVICYCRCVLVHDLS